MKAVALVLICGPLLAASLDGNKIVLTEDEVRRCAEAGGCTIITNDVLLRILEDGKTCRRSSV